MAVIRTGERMRAQSGVFLVEPLSREWTQIVTDDGLCDSVTLPAAWKRALLGIAVRTNNSGGTLFPGLDGVGRPVDVEDDDDDANHTNAASATTIASTTTLRFIESTRTVAG